MATKYITQLDNLSPLTYNQENLPEEDEMGRRLTGRDIVGIRANLIRVLNRYETETGKELPQFLRQLLTERVPARDEILFVANAMLMSKAIASELLVAAGYGPLPDVDDSIVAQAIHDLQVENLRIKAELDEMKRRVSDLRDRLLESDGTISQRDREIKSRL